jgi:hypothetical protein
MHVAGSLCTVKTFPFWADDPGRLEILLPDMLGDRRSRSTPATAPVFTILRRLISRPGAPHHAIKLSLPNVGKSYSCPLEPRRLKITIRSCTPHRCTSSSNSTEFPRPQIYDDIQTLKNHVSSCPRRPHLSGCTRFALPLVVAQRLGPATGISR